MRCYKDFVFLVYWLNIIIMDVIVIINSCILSIIYYMKVIYLKYFIKFLFLI